MEWIYSYTTPQTGGLTFNQGDTIIVKGQSYTSAYKDGYGYNYTAAETKKFYGYYSADGVTAPICLMDDYGNAQYFIEDSSIVGGGTRIIPTGNFMAYAKDRDRIGGAVFDPGGWFESIYLDWNNWGTGHGLTAFEIWYRQSNDGVNWSGRLRARNNIDTSNNYGNCTIGSVDQTTSDSNWGDRGKYFQFCVVGVDGDGHFSDTEFWSATYRKCTVSTYSFDANGGSNAPAKQYKPTTYNFVFPSTIPTRTGYSFAGWKRSGISTVYSAKQNVSGLPDSNITWYAQWTLNTHTLTVDPNGGTWSGSTSAQTFKQNYGTSKTIPNPTRTGYTFKGWSKSGSGSISGTTYTYGAGNGTLTAQWERIVLTVTFDASTNGGSPDSTKNVNYGDSIGTLPAPEKPYYKLVGWFTKAVGGTQISANNVITSNVTFYAQYKIDASVKVKYNGNNLPAIVWVKVNGVWKKCITWIKDNGKWNKSTGAD